MRLLFRRFNENTEQIRALMNRHHCGPCSIRREVISTDRKYINCGNLRATARSAIVVQQPSYIQSLHYITSTIRSCSTSSNGQNKNGKETSKERNKAAADAKTNSFSSGEEGTVKRPYSAVVSGTATDTHATNSAIRSSAASSTPASSASTSTTASVATFPPDTTTATTTSTDVPSSSSTRVTEALRSVNHTYEELEMNLMHRLHESNKNRFRSYLIGTILVLLWIISVFGDRIRKKMSQKTADFAKETLENESLKNQTQMLATAVVQTVLNDKEITTQAATFLQEASNAPETQAAFYQLTMHVLRHPETLAELTVLSKKLVDNLSEDAEVVAKLTKIFTQVLADPELKDAVIRLISELSGDPAVIAATSQLCLDLMVRDDVKEATTKLMTESSYEVLEDNEVNMLSKEFVADVMRDAQLQKEGGDALMNSITHALKPGVVKITGMSLICVSMAVFKLMLSPY